MTRKIKALIVAAMALAAFGAFNVAGAQAAEEFHCSIEPCKFKLEKDGTGTTAHHVFVVKDGIGQTISFTCNGLDGNGTAAKKTVAELTVTNLSSAAQSCKSVIGNATVDYNGCDYLFKSANGGTDKATVSVVCPAGKEIIVTNVTCEMKIGPQGPLAGIGYHNLGSTPTRTVTVTAKVPGIAVTPVSAAGCNLAGGPYTAEYTTGNTIVRPEDSLGAHVDGWWE